MYFSSLLVIDDFWVVGRALMVKLGPIMRLQTVFDSIINVGHPDDLEVII